MDLINYAKTKKLKEDLDSLVIGEFGTGFVTDAMLSDSGVKALLVEKANKINKLLYKTASVTTSGDTTFDSYQTNSLYQHLAYQGADMALVAMVNITSATDPAPVMMSDSKVIDCINMATTNGVKTVMLKPHLGVNWSDGFNRLNYNPSSYATFFDNWKTILLHYASMCDTYDIPVLCVGCEMQQTTVTDYASYWQDIYNTIKAQYPNLMLTYACNQTEWLRTDSGIFANVDYIGLNVYLQLASKPYNSSMTWEDIAPAFYNSYDVIGSGISAIGTANFLSEKYNKPIFITEVGMIPLANGYIELLPSGFDNPANYDYRIYAIMLQALFEVLKSSSNVVGVSIWHSCSAFSYWSDDTDIPNHLAGEEIVKKYFKEVL